MTEPVQDKDLIQEEKNELKARLDQMNVKYHHNASLDTLRGLLKEELGEPKKEEPKQERFNIMRSPANELVRCAITCMNPHKKDWQGEIFTAGNAYGTIRKFVPYNCEAAQSWHVPRIILEAMKSREYLTTNLQHTTKGDKINQIFLPEFTIVELPPLTQEELDKLAQDQRLAAQAGK